jgi:chromosome segregation ATPase
LDHITFSIRLFVGDGTWNRWRKTMTELDEIVKKWETQIKDLNDQVARLSRENWELQNENYGLKACNNELNEKINNNEPLYGDLLGAFKRQSERLSESYKENRKLESKIQELKAEVDKVNRWNTDHLVFLMEALKREPLKVSIVTPDSE